MGTWNPLSTEQQWLSENTSKEIGMGMSTTGDQMNTQGFNQSLRQKCRKKVHNR